MNASPLAISQTRVLALIVHRLPDFIDRVRSWKVWEVGHYSVLVHLLRDIQLRINVVLAPSVYATQNCGPGLGWRNGKIVRDGSLEDFLVEVDVFLISINGFFHLFHYTARGRIKLFPVVFWVVFGGNFEVVGVVLLTPSAYAPQFLTS